MLRILKKSKKQTVDIESIKKKIDEREKYLRHKYKYSARH